MQYQQVESNIYTAYKPAGYTPLQALDILRAEANIAKSIPLTYAGRLDPMAEGLLIVLAGEAVHKKDEFLKLDKTYVVTALLGVETDSFDLLGMPRQIIPHLTSPILGEEHIQRVLQSYIGKVTLPLPLYSSPPVDGKPLFQHAQENSMQVQDTPKRTTKVFYCALDNIGAVDSDTLRSYLHTTVASVHGNFRQANILAAWNQLLNTGQSFQTITFTTQCSSGTYVRSLVQALGTQLDTSACVYKLVRTRVGPYTIQ
jgi:tRNA pseudouridine55 synthase